MTPKPLTQNNVPVGINEDAVSLWKDTLKANRPVINMFDDLVDKWVAALVLFQDECHRLKVTPFKPDALANATQQQTLDYMVAKINTANELFAEFISGTRDTLKQYSAATAKPKLSGPKPCVMYEAQQCYTMEVTIVTKDASITDIARLVKTKGSFVLYKPDVNLYKGPTKNGVRTVLYLLQTKRGVNIQWIASMFAQNNMSLRGIKTKILQHFKVK